MIICRLREADFQKSSLAEFRGDARSFTGDRESCCVGGPWHARAVFGGPLALGSAGVENLYFNSIKLKIHLDIITIITVTSIIKY